MCCHFYSVFCCYCYVSFPGGTGGEEPSCQCRRPRDAGSVPRVGKIPWRRKWQSTPVFLPRKFRGQRSLVGHTVHGVAKSQTRLSDLADYCHVTPLPISMLCLSKQKLQLCSLLHSQPFHPVSGKKFLL